MAHTLVCCECKRRSVCNAVGWQGHLLDRDDDGRDEVAFFCPRCAAREFGTWTELGEGLWREESA